MEHITFKNDSALKKVCTFMEKAHESFIDETLFYLHVNDWISDSSDEWGKTLAEILTDENVDILGVALLCLKSNNVQAVNAFANITVIGKGDCTECGGDLKERNYEPDPTRSTDDYICGHCGHETKPIGLERDFEHFTNL